MSAAHPTVPFVLSFLLVSFVVALATTLIRFQSPRQILAETLRFFTAIVLCIAIFAVVVAVVEWIFIRPLI